MPNISSGDGGSGGSSLFRSVPRPIADYPGTFAETFVPWNASSASRTILASTTCGALCASRLGEFSAYMWGSRFWRKSMTAVMSLQAAFSQKKMTFRTYSYPLVYLAVMRIIQTIDTENSRWRVGGYVWRYQSAICGSGSTNKNWNGLSFTKSTATRTMITTFVEVYDKIASIRYPSTILWVFAVYWKEYQNCSLLVRDKHTAGHCCALITFPILQTECTENGQFCNHLKTCISGGYESHLRSVYFATLEERRRGHWTPKRRQCMTMYAWLSLSRGRYPMSAIPMFELF